MAKKILALLVMCRLAAGVVPSNAADWPQLAGNAQRTGRNPQGAGEPFTSLWQFRIPREGIARGVQPVICGGRVFFGSRLGVFRCLEAATGREAWRLGTAGAIKGTAAVENGRVFFGSTDGNLYAADAGSGAVLWKHDAGLPGFSAGVLVAGGRVFAGSRDGRFFCLAQEDGTPVWEARAGGPIFQAACYGDGKVFVGSEDMIFHAWDAATGKELWTSPVLPGQGFTTVLAAWPVYFQGNVMVHTAPYEDLFKDVGAKKSERARRFSTADAERDRQFAELWRIFEAAGGPLAEPADWTKFSDAISGWLAGYPEWRTFFVFDAATGEFPYVAPVIYVGHSGVSYPPVVDAKGNLRVMCGVPRAPSSSHPQHNMGGMDAVFDMDLGLLSGAGILTEFYHTHCPSWGRKSRYDQWAYYQMWKNIFGTTDVYGRGDFMAGWVGIAVGDRYVAMNCMDTVYCSEGR